MTFVAESQCLFFKFDSWYETKRDSVSQGKCTFYGQGTDSELNFFIFTILCHRSSVVLNCRLLSVKPQAVAGPSVHQPIKMYILVNLLHNLAVVVVGKK